MAELETVAQVGELGILVAPSAGQGALLVLEAELETLVQAAALQALLSLVAGLWVFLSPAELRALLSLAVGLGSSLALVAELRVLLAQAEAWKIFQVQAVGLEVFQDLLAESVVWKGFAARV